MSVVILDEGLEDRLRAIYGLNSGIFANRISLFTAVSPSLSQSTVKGDFTEPSIMGYAPIVFVSGWAFALDTTNHWVIATQNFSWTFTPGAGFTILGWFMWSGGGSGDNKAQMAEQLASPVVIAPGGGTYALTINDKYHGC